MTRYQLKVRPGTPEAVVNRCTCEGRACSGEGDSEVGVCIDGVLFEFACGLHGPPTGEDEVPF